MIGRVIDQFEILEQLGAGSMGVVYRAHDTRLRRDVALKFLPHGALADDTARRSFRREALALSRLNHPGIATVHDFCTHGELDYLVMELIDGESLEHRLERGPLAEPELAGLGVQLTAALAEAHRRGVIHRDLKPSNVLVTPDGRLKILDFGLARWLGDNASVASMADAGGISGTPAYLAPELLAGRPADERSDLYAVGVLLYEAATGRRPFAGLPTGALLEAIQRLPIPPPRTLRPSLSPALDTLIRRCLERDPARRFASAADVAAALARLGGPTRGFGRLELRAWPPIARWGAVAVFTVVASALVWWRQQARPAPATPIRSLAVLPLANLSRDPEQEYFALGMTEELIAQLSRVRALRITSLTSTRRYEHAARAMPAIARELGVDGVIEGSVLTVKGRLRTTVRLISANDDTQLWSGEYVGDTTDVLALQSRMARAIVREVQVRLSRDERARLRAPPRVDAVAHQSYLRGRYHWNRRTDAGIRLAIRYFEQSIARDSLYALAHAGLADAWAEAGLYGFVPPLEARERARHEALRAVALAPDLAEGHVSLGHVFHNFDWDWTAAEVEYRRAIELSPSNALAHSWLAHLLVQRGRFAQAREELRAAETLDPLSVQIALAAGVFDYYERRWDAALASLDRAAELDSLNPLLYRARAVVLDRSGRERDAVAALARSFALQGHPEIAAGLTRAYRDGGTRAAVDLLLAGLSRKRAAGAYEPAEHLAELYARTGRIEEAFEWLATALREHDTELNRLLVDPIFDPLRGDPRFARLLDRVGLAPAPTR